LRYRTGQAVGHAAGGRQLLGDTGREAAADHVRRLRLDPDDACRGQQRLDRQSDAGDQSAATDRDEYGIEIRPVLHQFDPEAAMPGDHIEVVERVHAGRSGCRGRVGSRATIRRSDEPFR
jgi:hypothetical protein